MGIITGSLDIKSGTGSIEIEHTGLPTTTMEIVDISEFGVNYNLKDNSKKANTVFFTPSEFKFSAFDALGNGDSLFNELDAIISTDEITARINFTTDGGHSWTDTFTFFANNIDFDYIKRTTKITSKLNVKLASATITDIFTANPGDVRPLQEDVSGTSIDCMLTKDFISHALSSAAPGSTPIVALNTLDNGDLSGNLSWIITAANETFVDAPGGNIPQITSAERALYLMAALDGSFVGALMGYSFMIGRNDQTQLPTLPNILPKDVLDLKIKPSTEDYLRIFVCGECVANTSGAPAYIFTGVKFGTKDSLNDVASKVLSVRFLVDFFFPVEYDTTNNWFESPAIDTFDAAKVTETSIATTEGSYATPTKIDPGFSPGDVMSYKDITVDWTNPDFSFVSQSLKTYIVSNYVNGVLFTDSPIEEDIPKDSDVNYVRSNWTTAGTTAADSYAKAYGATGGKIIELTINDVDKVKPYEAINLGTGFGFGIDNKTFRPSEIKYDLHKDTIKVRAYEI